MRKPETWQPVAVAALPIMARLENQFRDKFERDCADDAVATPQKETAKESA